MIERTVGQAADLRLVEANALGLSIPKTALEVSKLHPDIVVVNTSPLDRWICPYPSIQQPKSLLDSIRQAVPSARLVVLGPHVTVFPESSMKEMSSADIGIVGEPDRPISEIVSSIVSGEEVSDIPGIVYRQDSGDLGVNQGKCMENLDENPIPLYSMMHLEPYQRFGYYTSDLYRFPGLSTFILSSRGCPFKCAFCSLYIHGNGFRARTADNVVDEIELLTNESGVGIVRFQDPEFSIDRKRAERICGMILERGIQVAWSAEIRYSSVDRDLLELMKESGCYQLNYGLESANQEILDKVGKKQDLGQAEEAIRWSSRIGIHASNNLIFGLPGENQATLDETLRFAERLWRLPKISFARASISIPYPNTPLYQMGIEDGLFEPISSWSEFPKVLRASGQIGTEFRNIKDVDRAIRTFNTKLRKIEWSSLYGKHFWLKPRYLTNVVLPGTRKRFKLRMPGSRRSSGVSGANG